MPLRQLLLQAPRRCSPSPRLPQLSRFLLLCRALSILPSEASAMPPQRRSPPVQVRLPQSSPGSSSDPLGSGFHIDVDMWWTPISRLRP
ncbi:unnamed protein product [Urochloa humidicola]